jgi:hypothetical protein
MAHFDFKTDYDPRDDHKAFLNLILEICGVDLGQELIAALLNHSSEPSIFLSMGKEDILKVTRSMTTRYFLRNICLFAQHKYHEHCKKVSDCFEIPTHGIEQFLCAQQKARPCGKPPLLIPIFPMSTKMTTVFPTDTKDNYHASPPSPKNCNTKAHSELRNAYYHYKQLIVKNGE